MTASHTKPVAIVVGGSAGIGASCALRLAQTHEVWISFNRRGAEASAVVADIVRHGGAATAFPLDYLEPRSIRAARDGLVGALTDRGVEPRVDVLVNSAGTTGSGYRFLVEIDEDDWDSVWAINVGGPLEVLRQFTPLMGADGLVVNIGSAIARLGAIGYKSQAHYATTKAVLSAAVQALRDSTPGGPRMVNVLPGLVDTQLLRDMLGGDFESFASAIPAGRIGSPSDIADVVGLLVSSARHIAGEGVIVDGGWTQQGWLRISPNPRRRS
jgi:3-oxoacyl-[acyl-carrier protein] reductase